MKIAILGGGFAGLAVAWFVLHYTKGASTVDLYDPVAIGQGVSGISAGLLHPYSNRRAQRSWEATSAINETHRLLTEASRSLNQPLVLSNGLIRPALTESQVIDFKRCAQEHPDTEWWDKKRCEDTIPGMQLPDQGGGLFIKEAITIDVPSYMQGLWQSCAVLGSQFHNRTLTNPEELAAYDKILVAMGSSCKNYAPLKDLPITPIKGQILELEWPHHIPPLTQNLIGEKYIVMSKDNKSCFVGATFERNYTSSVPNQTQAALDILPSIASYFPALADAKILGCKSGIRAASATRLPLIGTLAKQIYFFTGLGSKGLLYHAWLAKYVARALISADPSHIPKQVWCVLPKSS